MVPLAANTALGIAIMSYNGQLNFGLTADYDALPDVGGRWPMICVRDRRARCRCRRLRPGNGPGWRHA